MPGLRSVLPGVRGRVLSAASIDMQALWPAAIAALPVVAILAWHPSGGKSDDLLQYLAQGTVVPALLLTHLLLERRYGRARLVTARVVLGCIAVAAAVGLVVWQFSLAAIVLVGLQLAVTALVTRRPLAGRSSWPGTIRTALVLVVAWIATLTLIWWVAPVVSPVQLLNGTTVKGAPPVYAIGVLIVVLAALFLSVKKLYPRQAATHVRWRWLPGIAATALFAVAACQTLGLQTADAALSWGFYVGPAELVRQGGWPLWDVPSQYGVLSVLLLAWLPTGSPWESLFMLNAVANILLALLVYWALRRPGAGWLDWTGAALIALAVVFLRAGLFPYFAGPPIFPSTGGYRFLLCVALLAVLMRVARDEDGRLVGRWLVAGTVLWLASLAWSAEAAFYATATWIPAYLLLAWRAAHGDRGRLARLIAAPIGAAAAEFAVVAVIYLLGLGHFPDLRAYIEYASAYAGGFGAIVASPSGPALALLFCLVILAALWVRSVRVAGFAHARTAYLTGAFLAVWATSSYFASRSHPNNAVNLAPIYVVSLFGALRLTVNGIHTRTRSYLTAVLVPVTASLLIGSFGYLDAVATYVTHPPADLTAVQPLFWKDVDLATFMANAGIGPHAPLVLVDDPDQSHLPPQADGDPRFWLPVAPYGEIDLLPPANRAVHLERFVLRNRASGWLITDGTHAGDSAWLREALLQWYSPTYTTTQGRWTATYYRYRGAGT